eukprot:2032987-Amphidinium_carterae.1
MMTYSLCGRVEQASLLLSCACCSIGKSTSTNLPQSSSKGMRLSNARTRLLMPLPTTNWSSGHSPRTAKGADSSTRVDPKGRKLDAGALFVPQSARRNQRHDERQWDTLLRWMGVHIFKRLVVIVRGFVKTFLEVLLVACVLLNNGRWRRAGIRSDIRQLA